MKYGDIPNCDKYRSYNEFKTVGGMVSTSNDRYCTYCICSGSNTLRAINIYLQNWNFFALYYFSVSFKCCSIEVVVYLCPFYKSSAFLQ